MIANLYSATTIDSSESFPMQRPISAWSGGNVCSFTFLGYFCVSCIQIG